MSAYHLQSRSRLLTRVATIALLAGLAAGCSGSVERFGDPIYTGGTANQRDILSKAPRQPSYDEIAGNGPARSSAPQSRSTTVASAPLPPVGGSNRNQPLYTASVSPRESVAQPAQPPMPAAIPNSAVHSGRTYGGWTSAGGTVVTLGQGETIESAARRYGVPAKAIVAVNDIKNPAAVQPGTQIIIPTYVYNGGNSGSTARAPRTVDATAPKPVSTEPVRVASNANVVPSAKPRQPHTVAAAPTPVTSAPVGVDLRPQRKPEIDTTPRAAVASSAPKEPIRPSTPERSEPRRDVSEPDRTITASINRSETPQEAAEAGDARFRWPVRGRIISTFGSKPGGTRNDGINLAVPEGTAVRAVESGTVIYSGNELKGYGNLVLIRHEDGWVSAYAHNSELDVRRGDTVRRGDVVAKAGSTGSVNQPQLHFELRRGNKPVDPMQFLPKSS